jgi:hypothetical protein
MQYKIIKKKIGLHSSETYTSFDFNEISQFAIFEDRFVFISENVLYLSPKTSIDIKPLKNSTINENNICFKDIGGITNISVCQKSHRMFLLNTNRDLYMMDANDLSFDYQWDNIYKKWLSDILIKYPNKDVSMCCYENHIYFSLPQIKKIFEYYERPKHIAGDGKPFYSTGCSALNTSIGVVSDICCDKNSVYFCDNIHNIIRCFRNGMVQDVVSGLDVLSLNGEPCKLNNINIFDEVLYFGDSYGIFAKKLKSPSSCIFHKPNEKREIVGIDQQEGFMHILLKC